MSKYFKTENEGEIIIYSIINIGLLSGFVTI